MLLLVLFFLVASFFVDAKPSSAASASENTWTTEASIPEAERGVRSAVVNGKIYVMGGSINYEYNPATDSWVEKTAMPTPRTYFGIAAYQNKIYVMGGRPGWTSASGNIDSCANEIYDPSTDTWETKTAMPVNISDINANVVDGMIYIMGGFSSRSPQLSLNVVYDVAKDSWTNKTTMPYPVRGSASAVVDNRIYVIGGSNPSLSNYTQIYDPRTDSWSLGASIPTLLYTLVAGATTGVMASKKIYVIGGDSGFEGVDFTQVYDPVADSWRLGASMPTARLALTVAVVNDQVYAIAGSSYAAFSPVLTANERYTPFGYGSPDPSYDVTPPEITVSYPENKTYYSANVTLGFVVNEQASWMGYSLDGSDKVTVDGNVTLSGLSVGVHNVTVYVWDTVGNAGVSENVTFTIAEPFPIVSVMVVFILVVIGVVLLVYFKKYGH